MPRPLASEIFIVELVPFLFLQFDLDFACTVVLTTLMKDSDDARCKFVIVGFQRFRLIIIRVSG
jgi:hypothetical protein